MSTTATSLGSWCHRPNRHYDRRELVADALVHVVGLVLAVGLGREMLSLSVSQGGPFWAPMIHVGSLIALLCVSLAFNLCPPVPIKRLLARLDQAAIFLFIAGTYTPFLLAVDSATGRFLLLSVWGISLLGAAGKILIPERFSRIAIAVYLLLGWSSLIAFVDLTSTLSPQAMALLVTGGVIYSVGIVPHLWEKLYFHTVIWHMAVVSGATLHLLAAFECLR